MPTTSVIIPQYGRHKMTHRLISQIRRFESPEIELIIVDDGSPDDDVSSFRPDWNVRYYQQMHRGVTAAWNAGAKLAASDVLVFLNNDVVVCEQFIHRLIEPLKHARVAMTGPRLRTETLAPKNLSPHSPRSLLEGWCFAVLRDTFERLEGFDEQFRMYFSDTDFQWRLVALEEEAALIDVPQLPLQHQGHASTRTHPARHQLHREDCQRFVEKWKV